LKGKKREGLGGGKGKRRVRKEIDSVVVFSPSLLPLVRQVVGRKEEEGGGRVWGREKEIKGTCLLPGVN